MHAYATLQKLLCHGNYFEVILSLVRALCRLSFAARPPQEIRQNPRQLMTQSLYKHHPSALLQASLSLSIGSTRAWLRSLPVPEKHFRHFAREFSILDSCGLGPITAGKSAIIV